jgi:hypothetical protein
MLEDWMDRLWCVLMGHKPDAAGFQRRFAWLAKHSLSGADPVKTRCMRCGVTRYVRRRRWALRGW